MGSASLIHVPRAALPGTLAAIHRALKPGGLHLATFKALGSEGRDPDGRYYNYPTSVELAAFYAKAAPRCDVRIANYVGGGYAGGQGPWAMVEVRRPGG